MNPLLTAVLNWSVREEVSKVQCDWIDYVADHPEEYPRPRRNG